MTRTLETSPVRQWGGTTVIVAYHFYPSPEVGAKRVRALADHLRRGGQRVTVVSAFEGLEALADNDARWEELRGYDLIRVPVERSVTLALLVRIKRFVRGLRSSVGARHELPTTEASTARSSPASAWAGTVRDLIFDVLQVIDDKKRWSMQAARRLVAASIPPATSVIVVSGPPMSPLFGAIWAGRRLGVPVIVDLRDPMYLETEQGRADHSLERQWGRHALERYVLRRASYVTTTSPSLLDTLRRCYPQIGDRISCIYNGFDEEPLAQRPGTGCRLVIVYAGTLYLNRDPFPFLEAVGHLFEQEGVDGSRVEVIFAGDCEQYNGVSLRRWLADRPWGSAVTIYPLLDAQELKRLYCRATLLLNFAEGQRMQVPAKTFELLALGRELLVLCEPDSDTARLVSSLEGVSCVQSRDKASLREMLHDVYRRHVVEGTLRAPSQRDIREYRRATQNEHFAAVIENVRSSARVPQPDAAASSSTSRPVDR